MSKKFAALLCHLIIRASSKLRHQDSIIVNARIRIFFGKRSLVSEQGREIKALTEANEDNEERLYYPIQLKLEIFVSFVAYCEISATDPNCQNARYFAGIYSVSRQLWECVRVLASLWGNSYSVESDATTHRSPTALRAKSTGSDRVTPNPSTHTPIHFSLISSHQSPTLARGYCGQAGNQAIFTAADAALDAPSAVGRAGALEYAAALNSR
jgi:hypothetical protein